MYASASDWGIVSARIGRADPVVEGQSGGSRESRLPFPPLRVCACTVTSVPSGNSVWKRKRPSLSGRVVSNALNESCVAYREIRPPSMDAKIIASAFPLSSMSRSGSDEGFSIRPFSTAGRS